MLYKKDMPMMIESPAFEQHHTIPERYTYAGDNISPPLKFNSIPKDAVSLVLIVDDPDAPRGTVDHWIVWNIPAKLNDVKEGAHFSMTGTNTYGETRYRGPYPPPGKPHRYFFKLYALDSRLDLPVGSSKSEVEKAIQGHIQEEAELVGLFQR